MDYYVYFMTNWSNKVLYVGVTNDLKRRLFEHITGKNQGFTFKYNLNKLVYYEVYNDSLISIRREKQIKKWTREKKNNLVELKNPNWEDLGKKIFPGIYNIIKTNL